VDPQIAADAMAGAVVVIDAVGPQELARQDVELAAGGAGRETRPATAIVRVTSVVPSRYWPPESTRYSMPISSRRSVAGVTR
jgi:hypothetical protein